MFRLNFEKQKSSATSPMPKITHADVDCDAAAILTVPCSYHATSSRSTAQKKNANSVLIKEASLGREFH